MRVWLVMAVVSWSRKAFGGHGLRRNVRWILVHMLEEYSRHAGHLDLLREAADGTVGD